MTKPRQRWSQQRRLGFFPFIWHISEELTRLLDAECETLDIGLTWR
jgi:hypothetical protein